MLCLIIVRTVTGIEFSCIRSMWTELSVGINSIRTSVPSCSQEVGNNGLVVDGPGSLISQSIESLERIFKFFVY